MDEMPNRQDRTSAFKEASLALEAIRATEPLSCCERFKLTAEVTHWSPGKRTSLVKPDLELVSHRNEQTKLSELLRAPTFLTFFYSRCENENKCSSTMNQVGQLQSQLAEDRTEYRIILLTLEHQDSVADMKRFAADRGVDVDDPATFICRAKDVTQQRKLLELLEVPVNYSGDWVNIHGICGFIADSKARLAFVHRGTIWNVAEVAKQLAALSAKPTSD